MERGVLVLIKRSVQSAKNVEVVANNVEKTVQILSK